MMEVDSVMSLKVVYAKDACTCVARSWLVLILFPSSSFSFRYIVTPGVLMRLLTLITSLRRGTPRVTFFDAIPAL